MFGFLFGTACLIGLFGVGGGPRWRHHHRFGGGRWSAGGWRGGWRGGLYGLFQRLDASPAQEKAVRSALEDLFQSGAQAKSAATDARRAFARAVRDESLDEVALGEATARLDDAADALKKAFIEAAGSVHATLDERQRRILADVIERGPGAFEDEANPRGRGREACGRGPYRAWGYGR